MKMLNLIAMLSFLLQACGSRQPAQNDIVGTWKSPDGAILVFSQDGTFSGKSLPAEYFTFYTSKSEIEGKKVNGTGKWDLKKGQDFEEIGLIFQKMNKKEVYGLYSVMISGDNGILENKPPWYLFVWKGGEGGERYKFIKK